MSLKKYAQNKISFDNFIKAGSITLIIGLSIAGCGAGGDTQKIENALRGDGNINYALQRDNNDNVIADDDSTEVTEEVSAAEPFMLENGMTIDDYEAQLVAELQEQFPNVPIAYNSFFETNVAELLPYVNQDTGEIKLTVFTDGDNRTEVGSLRDSPDFDGALLLRMQELNLQEKTLYHFEITVPADSVENLSPDTPTVSGEFVIFNLLSYRTSN